MVSKHLKLLFLTILFGSFSVLAFAQEKEKKTEEEPELPPAEVVTVKTEDGVSLKCEWYPGTNGKLTIPVILIHDWGNDRRGMLPLAARLQAQHGYAVLVPDLRGHGQSVKHVNRDEPLDHTEFKKAQIASVVNDIEACRRFFMEKNNNAELNVEMLSLVASHHSCVHALNWAVMDWSWEPLPDGTKQGQYVKAIVMLSPVRRFKSMNMSPALKTPVISGRGMQRPPTIAIFWGSEDATSNREAKALHTTLAKSRVDPNDFPKEDRWIHQDLFQISYSTESVGEDLLSDNASSKLANSVGVLLQRKMVDQAEDYRWQDHSKKE